MTVSVPQKSRLELAADKVEIREVLMRYCRAIDRNDLPLLRTVYHDDAWEEHGFLSCPASDYCERIMDLLANREMSRHDITNSIVDVAGDTALSEAYFLSIQRESGSAFDDWIAGRYLDRFERRNGEWRVLKRRLVLDWTRRMPYDLDGNTAFWSAFPHGERGGGDPLYQEQAFPQSRPR